MTKKKEALDRGFFFWWAGETVFWTNSCRGEVRTSICCCLGSYERKEMQHGIYEKQENTDHEV